MQTASYASSNSFPNFKPPWTTSYKTLISIPINPLKPNSLGTSSFSFQFQEQDQHAVPTPLPVVIRRSGGVSRYIWDGDELKLVSLDGNLESFSFRLCTETVRNFFLPREISENYLEYVKWKFLHRVFSSALQVLATQAMFRAIGIGYSRSLPSAAALNWVLKDGLGRFSRCIYTASLASAFDTNLKRVRFTTSVMFSLSIGIELLTPAFPHYFLLLASIANIAKQISLACYLATGSAVHRSFAIADNLGEVSAKAQIQSVCFDNLGLMLAAALNVIFRNNQRFQAGLPFVIYPIFTMIDLFGIYQSLKHVHLQTLTKDRLEIIINTWIEFGYVPSPAQVSDFEGIDFLGRKGKKIWPIRIGCLYAANTQIQKLSMMTMRSLNNEDFYFLCMESFSHGFTGSIQQGIVVCLREGAGTSDVIMGLLQACYARKGLLDSENKWKTIIGDEDSEFSVTNWFKVMQESKGSAQVDMNLLYDNMLKLGWACKNVLLSTKEQERYSFVHD